ncbi:MAG: hypothetical protein M4579_000004 [Chaenotheca gracillima]|nr:MAG: hypothetical protein M4579_000004 [Chaenotheca gracillima]
MPPKGARQQRTFDANNTYRTDDQLDQEPSSATSSVSTETGTRRSARLLGLSAPPPQLIPSRRRRQPQVHSGGLIDGSTGTLPGPSRVTSTTPSQTLPATRADGEYQDMQNGRLQAEPQYDMDLLVQPPMDARPGVLLYPPITVGLRGGGMGDMEMAMGEEHTGSLIAVATLVDESGRVPLAPPRSDLLLGILADTPHPVLGGRFSDDENTDSGDRESSPDGLQNYLMFPRISIEEAGSYRIRVELRSMSFEGSTAGTSTIHEVLSRIIRIHPGLRVHGMS